ncbi:MAG: F0F1 ATP synthase subunit B [Leptolyngbyaceae cyanobacterium SM1_1_3]|nr:F0F1 ATP synthase subunit B [Leptolyngbyaceae cyanobacterium SM1_1_3]NJN02378.1 F0F1 ATP synthase subunit B [Leptolyngbyaceae cyanobacterium RM1_1_2]NJO11464.1 F0F1 ATP synthase subunit B [Leptolyngbyaceae cyanobacterium SL_1_1]
MESIIFFKLLAVEEGGVGLNFDLLETNLINLAIIIGALFYFGSKFLGNTLATRRQEIESAIKAAEKRKQEASSALAEQQQKLAQAQVEAEQIRSRSEENAARAEAEVQQQADRDVERLRAAAEQDLSAQQDKVMRELQQRLSALAIKRVEERLPERLNDDVQRQLVDKSIALLGGR